MARYILFDGKYDYEWHHSLEPLERVTTELDAEAHSKIADIQRVVDAMAAALIGGTAVFMCASLGMTMFLMGKILDLRAAGISADSLGRQWQGKGCFQLAIFAILAVILGVMTFELVHVW